MSVFVALKEKPEYYEAYVYIVVFDHGKRMKYYLGWHKGKFDGTYKGTPKTHEKEFYNDLRKYDYKVFAIAFGTSQNMIYKEKKMLDNAKTNGNWDEYYNESTGGGAKLKNYNPVVEEIQDKIESGELGSIELPKGEVNEMEPWQVRLQALIVSHVTAILEQMNDSDGAYLETHRGVIVLKDFYGPGKHCRIGSKHTVAASMKCKYIEDLKVIFIPKNLWKKLDNHDIKELGQWDNPQDKQPRLPTDQDETSDWIAEACIAKGIDPDHQSFTDKLLKQGYTKKQIPFRIKKAESIIADKEEISPSEIQINWDTKPHSNALKAKEVSFKGIAWSAAVGNPEKMIVELVNLFHENPDQRRFKLFTKVGVKLGAGKVKKAWETKWYKWVRDRFDHFENTMYLTNKGKKTLKIDIEALEFTTPNPLYKEDVL